MEFRRCGGDVSLLGRNEGFDSDDIAEFLAVFVKVRLNVLRKSLGGSGLLLIISRCSMHVSK